MNNKNVWILPSRKTLLPAFPIVAGQPYPILSAAQDLPDGFVQISSYNDGSLLIIQVRLDTPSKEQRDAFRRGVELRLYRESDLPGGLLLLRMRHKPGKVMHIHPAPFCPPKQLARWPGTLDAFEADAGKPIKVVLVLTDVSKELPMVVDLQAWELPDRLCQDLREIWSDHRLYETYAKDFRNLMANRTGRYIWTTARTYA